MVVKYRATLEVDGGSEVKSHGSSRGDTSWRWLALALLGRARTSGPKQADALPLQLCFFTLWSWSRVYLVRGILRSWDIRIKFPYLSPTDKEKLTAGSDEKMIRNDLVKSEFRRGNSLLFHFLRQFLFMKVSRSLSSLTFHFKIDHSEFRHAACAMSLCGHWRFMDRSLVDYFFARHLVMVFIIELTAMYLYVR